MSAAIEAILAGPGRVACQPFPEFTGIELRPGNLGIRDCLRNQAAGRMIACAGCRTGRRLRREHPGLFRAVKKQLKPDSWGNPWPRKQEIMRQQMAGSAALDRARQRGEVL